MKLWFSYLLSLLLGGLLVILAFYILLPYHTRQLSFTSPLPDFLSLTKNKQVTLLDLWTPIWETFAEPNEKPEIQARAVLMYDLTDSAVLFEKAARTKMPMASLTKIMTAIIALEDPSMPEKYVVHGADLVGEDSMGLEAGEVLNKEELLYGLMLNSGNDASEVLASNYPLGREAFLQAMHDKAAALGLKDTRFSNPSGLEGDGIQHTTAYDLLVITRYAIEHFPIFTQISSTYEHHIPANSQHKEFNLVNETNLISSYEGVKGVKTGYTPEAGMCLITYYEKDGVKLLGILLNSPDRRGEMRTLLDYSLTTLGHEPPVESSVY